MEKQNITDKLKIIQETAEELLPNANNPGLLNGKMGGVLYFYLLAEKSENVEYKELANILLNRVYKDIESEFVSLDFENGLAGISWGFEYLKQRGMIIGPNQDILDRMDDRIYRHIGYSGEGPAGLLNGDLGYILYLLPKFRGSAERRNRNIYTLYERLLIELINRLGNYIEDRKMKFEEPSTFDNTWDLPVCLWLLGEVSKAGIHDVKINRILDQLSPLVLSLFPRLQSNRLSVCQGMLSILQHHKMEEWQVHTTRLLESISIEKMIRQEMFKNNLSYLDGIAGVSVRCRKMAELYPGGLPEHLTPMLLEAVTSSPFWNDVETDMMKRNNIGLLSGLMGIGLELIYLDEYCRKNININSKTEMV